MVGFVDFDDLRLAYRELGEGPPVLLLHGWPTSSYLWRDVMPAIAEAGNRAIAPDLPGYGRSERDPDADHSHEAQARVVAALLDHLGVRGAAVLGHSIGAAVALRLAAARPDLAAMLILAGGG